jgi:hypothetical protein
VGQSITAASLPVIDRRKADDACNYASLLYLKRSEEKK